MAALLVGSFGAHAAGLGKLTVYSAIGQPLNAEVAVTATPEELNSLSARIASHDAFKEAGIEFMPALTGLRFSVIKSASGQPVLHLTTDAPLNEPFLHFLVELNWMSGRMVREYTFLLDPPEMLKVPKPAAAVSPAVVESIARPAAKPVVSSPAPVRVELAPAAPSPASTSTAKKVSASEVHVKQGDTLSKIARENLPATISLDQMLVALFNKNREVFDGDNMNRLRAGKILRVPDAVEAAKATPTEAHKVVLNQGADFNAYRRHLAEAAGSAASGEVPAGQQVTGKIKSPVEEKAAPVPKLDKLEVSRTETGRLSKTDGKDDAASKARLEEELLARDKSLREASERIAQLEKNLENLKKLVELKSQAGVQLQQQAVAPTKPALAPIQPAVPAPAVVSAPAPASATVPTAPEPRGEPAAVPVAATPVVSAESAATSAAVEPPKPATKKQPILPPPPPEPEPSFVEDNPELVFGGGGLIALLLGYLGFSAWRKKKQAREPAVDFSEIPSAMDEAAPVPVVAAPAVLTDDVSILGDFSESGALTSEENVDPVAEADVLMAYGRDGQAEEILLEGLKTDPERNAIRVKLLELYANRNDTARFEAVAVDVRRLSGETGPDWNKTLVLAAGMGVSLAEETVAPAPSVHEAVAVITEEVDLPVAEEDDSNKTVILSAPPAVEISAEPSASASEAGDSLDFDLDLGTTSGPAQAAAQQAADVESATEEVMSLDFDFDLGSPETTAATLVPVAASAAPETEIVMPAPVDGNAMDFSFDLDAPVAATPEPEEPPAVASVEEVPAGNVMDFDIDLGEPEMAAAIASSDESLPAGGTLADLKLDFDLDLDAAAPAVEADVSLDAIAVDLPVEESGIENTSSLDAAETTVERGLDMDLSLDTDVPPLPAVSIDPVEMPVVAAGGVGEIELPDLELTVPTMDVALDEPAQQDSMTEDTAASLGISALDDLPEEVAVDVGAASAADDPEVATKLELAQAYEEMGDREGARELLNEVLTEGSVAQQAAARTRLDQLEA